VSFLLQSLQSQIILLEWIIYVCKIELVCDDLFVSGANFHFLSKLDLLRCC